MFSQTSFFWFLTLLYLIPILLTGILIFRRILSVDRLELLIPAGSIFGITLFVFFINLTSFFVGGGVGINLAYFLLLLTLLVVYFKKSEQPKLKLVRSKMLLVGLGSILVWGILIFWKSNFALIGSDTNLYYAVAHTFIKGNVITLTPWQPDLPLVYHLGAFQLLGAFHFFTDLSFEFLHILFSFLFIFFSSQIIIWLWKKDSSITSFLWGNLAAVIIIICFGFLKFVLPVSDRLPQISSLNQFFLWIRNLPLVDHSIEAYGAPVNLDTLIYFIFHSFGLAVVLSLIVILVYSKENKPLYKWIVFAIGLSTLALINESVFVISALALIIGGILKEIQLGNFRVKSKFILPILLVMSLFIFIQGGTITNLLLRQDNLEKSILIFPSYAEKGKQLISYHHGQITSKWLPLKEEWLPFNWFHIGIDLLILFCIGLFIFTKFSKDQKILSVILLIMGLSSLLAYLYIIPKYLAANGNRFLVFAFISFSLFIIYSLNNFFESFSKRFLKYFLFGILALFILVPTILPPLARLSKTRFGESKLIPKKEQTTKGIKWIKDNLPYNSRIAVLDIRAPHPSGMARAMVQAGVFAPIFPSRVRVYTIEASPEYLDIAYFLNPQALKELNISHLLIDADFFKSLPDLRKNQLEDNKLFIKIFETENSEEWEKIYEISDEYFANGEQIKEGFKEFAEIFPSGRIYIDNEENFSPSFLRRAIIFTLKDKEIYYLSQSGVYLNVEASVNHNNPKEGMEYSFLVLGKNSSPNDICQCRTELVWKGLKNEIFVWKTILK